MERQSHLTGFHDFMLNYPGLDKVVHFIASGAIFLLVYVFMRFAPLRFRFTARLSVAIAISALISSSDEFRQIYIGGRTFEYADLFANTLGILTGATVSLRNYLKRGTKVIIFFTMISLMASLIYDSYKKQVHFSNAVEYERRGEYKKAKEEYLLAKDAGYGSASVYNNLAWIDLVYLKEDPEKSYQYAKKAFAMKPENADFIDTLGWAAYGLQKFDEALELLHQAEKMKPDMYCINYHLGLTYYAVGDDEKAIHYLKTQIAAKPNSIYAGLATEVIEEIRQASHKE